MSDRVDINDKDGFRATLHTLKTLRAELEKPSAAAFTEALAKAAAGHGGGLGARVFGGGPGPVGHDTGAAGATPAPIYASTVEATGTFTEAAEKQIAAAKASLDAVIADLEHLLSGLSDIDAGGAGAIRRATPV